MDNKFKIGDVVCLVGDCIDEFLLDPGILHKSGSKNYDFELHFLGDVYMDGNIIGAIVLNTDHIIHVGLSQLEKIIYNIK